ncbi:MULTISPECIES: hypothetical protein [Sphingomonas]|uniref:Uncharacterized protein n=1 Tax=Sphingomonas kyungheensis TaxID=1069987 RepID=A0ABU8H2W2_9SPHN|nr:hypothetical protein [Sphingomonas sp. RIT328]EZP49032.1 hypothetical protein BW41_03700 [Sphingomonas sp. RIT328]
MPYHHPVERRRGDRRVAARPATPDRRLAERRRDEVKLVRKPEPMHRGVLWAAVAMILILADSVFLDGTYRHMLIDGFDGVIDGIRNWSAHLWDWGH